MPNISLRARPIKVLSRYVDLEQYFYQNQIKALKNISGGDEDLEDLAELYELYLEHSAAKALLNDIRSRRYFLGRGNRVPKASTVARRLEFLDELDDEGFLAKDRMSKSSFDKLVDLIKDSPAYSKKKPQTPVRVQIAMALKKLGTYGNGASFGRMGRKYGTGKGSLPNFLKRFFKAIMPLESQYVYWPHGPEKKAIMAENKEPFGFPDCLGFIDSSLVELEYRPKWRREDFYTGFKKAYGITCVGVCDDERRLRFFGCGWVGCANDMRVLPECDLGEHPEKYFVGNEYVLGDAGYTSCNYLIAVKKKPRSGELSPADEKFNKYIAVMRIKIEHAFGILKSRFKSLNKRLVKIRCYEDLLLANVWIRTCVILNNFLLEQRDDPMTIRLKELWDKVERQRRMEIENGRDVHHADAGSSDQYVPGGSRVGKEKYNYYEELILTENGYKHLLQQ